MEDQQVRERNKKRELRRYKNNCSCIARLEEKLKNIESRLSSIKSPSFSGMPRGGIPVSPSDLVADKIELEERIERLKEKGKILKRDILEEIDSLENPRYCEVLEAYFIDGYSLEEIAEKEGYNDRHVYRLYSKAINLLILKDNECQ